MNRNIARAVARGDADLMNSAGIFAKVLSDLFQENWMAKHADEPEFLNEFRMDGLMMGLKIVAGELCSRSEWLNEKVDKEEAEEEKLAQAALARRQGRDDHQQSNVGAECGTQRAA